MIKKMMFVFLALGAAPCLASAAPARLSDSQMNLIAAGAPMSGGGISVGSTSQSVNTANIHEVLTGSATHPLVTSGNQNSTVEQTATSTSTAACTNCTSASSGIDVNSTSQAINIANVHEVVTGGALHKASGPITLTSTIDQTATSASTASCTNCTSTSGIDVNSTSQAINIANVHQVVAGGPKASGSVTMNSSITQSANSTSVATCTNCTSGSGIGVNSTSQAVNIANVHQVTAGARAAGVR